MINNHISMEQHDLYVGQFNVCESFLCQCTTDFVILKPVGIFIQPVYISVLF